MSSNEAQRPPRWRRTLWVVAAATTSLVIGVAGRPSRADVPVVSAGRAPAGSPLAGLDAPTGDVPSEATVVERIAAGPYSYLRVTDDAGREAWLATLGEGAAPGARVAIRSFGARRDFASKRLGRTFARVDFALVSKVDRTADREEK